MEENGLLDERGGAERFGAAAQVLHDHRPRTGGAGRVEERRGRARATSSMRLWRGTLDRTIEGYLAELRRRRWPAPIPRSCKTPSTTPRSTSAARVAEGGGDARGGRRRDRGVRHARGGRGRVPRCRAHGRRRLYSATRAYAEVRRTRFRPLLRRRRRPAGVGRALLHAARARHRHHLLHDRGDRLSLTLGTLVLIIGMPMALLTFSRSCVRSRLPKARIVEGLLGVRMPRRPRCRPERRGRCGSASRLAHRLAHVDDDALHAAAASARHHLLHGGRDRRRDVGWRSSRCRSSQALGGRADRADGRLRLLHRAVGVSAVRGRRGARLRSRRSGWPRASASCTGSTRR